MHVFDLFEGHAERKDGPNNTASKNSPDQRAVSGVRGDIYNKTNIAGVRRAIDNAIQSEPGAKSEIEAIVSYLDKQAQKNAEQENEIERLEREENKLRQSQDALVKDLQDKENRFRELTAQVASGKIDQVQAAQMAQDIEAGKEPAAPQQKVQTVAQPSQPTAQASRPSLRAVPGGAGSSQPAPAQAKTTAQPVDKAQPDTSRAIGQMAAQLGAPGRVIRGKTPSAANQPADQSLPNNVTDLDKVRAEKQAKLQQAFGGTGTYGLEEQVPTGAGDSKIAAQNEAVIIKAYMADTSAKLTFLTGMPLELKPWQVHELVEVFKKIPAGANKEALKINLFSNRTFLIEWMFENIVNPATATNRPNQDVKDEPESGQGQLTLEGDVVPFTDQKLVNQAYADALTFLKYAYANPNNASMLTTMRQDFAHKYQQRFQISQAPDRSYYLLDKQQSKRYNMPTPEFRGLEEEPHDGKSVWSDGQGQWSSENNQISSGNNPHGFSEGVAEENRGLYYNVNKRKKAGTSRPAGHPKAPTAQAWKDAAKTAKKESVAEGKVKTLIDDLRNMSENEFLAKYKISKTQAQRVYGSMLKPAPQQTVPVQENYWQRLQRERGERQHAKAWSLLEQALKDL